MHLIVKEGRMKGVDCTPFLTALVQERRRSANTVASYRQDLKHFAAYLETLGVHAPKQVERRHVERYLLELRQQGRAPATIARALVSLRAYFHYLLEKGELQLDPARGIAAPRQERQQPQTLAHEEIRRLLAAPDESTPLGLRDRAMLELLYAAGLRASELANLRLEQLHLTLRFVRCVAEDGKERIVPFGVPAAQALQRYLEKGRPALAETGATEAVFLNPVGEPLSRQGIWKILKKHAKLAQIAAPISPQVLRHSFAAHLLDNGADVRAVQELLGHADATATLAYASRAKGRMKDMYEQAHPRAMDKADWTEGESN